VSFQTNPCAQNKKLQDEVGQRHDPRGLQLSLDKAVARGEDLDARRKAAERDVAHLRAQLNAATAPAVSLAVFVGRAGWLCGRRRIGRLS
jgi:hypothetical protein